MSDETDNQLKLNIAYNVGKLEGRLDGIADLRARIDRLESRFDLMLPFLLSKGDPTVIELVKQMMNVK